MKFEKQGVNNSNYKIYFYVIIWLTWRENIEYAKVASLS